MFARAPTSDLIAQEQPQKLAHTWMSHSNHVHQTRLAWAPAASWRSRRCPESPQAHMRRRGGAGSTCERASCASRLVASLSPLGGYHFVSLGWRPKAKTDQRDVDCDERRTDGRVRRGQLTRGAPVSELSVIAVGASCRPGHQQAAHLARPIGVLERPTD